MKLSALLLTGILTLTAADARAQAPAPAQTAAPQPKAGKKTARPRRRQTARPAPVDSKKVNILLYGSMERLEIFSALYENLGLRLSTDTLKKAYEVDKAVNKAAAPYFGVKEPGTDRESIKNYRGLLESSLRSVRILKEIKDRLRPAAAETAILAVRDLYLAMDEEIARARLTPVTVDPRQARTEPPGAGASKPTVTGEDLANEVETLVAISEVTFALSAYRKEEGKFPARLKDLEPKYLPALPAISIADHPKTAEVVEIDSTGYDKDYSKAFNDTGKWLYFSHKKSRYYGRIFVDCTHKDAQGAEFFRIGEGK